jgi:hypothetical protein
MKKASLGELMGKTGSFGKGRKLSLDDLGDLLGERMPELKFNPVGRMRLTTALRNRFGDSYSSLPGIDNIMREFDENAKFEVTKAKMKMLGKK